LDSRKKEKTSSEESTSISNEGTTPDHLTRDVYEKRNKKGKNPKGETKMKSSSTKYGTENVRRGEIREKSFGGARGTTP